MATAFTIESQQIQPDASIVSQIAELPEAPPVIQLDHIHKTYTMGDVEVHALRGVSHDLSRRVCRDHGRFGFG